MSATYNHLGSTELAELPEAIAAPGDCLAFSEGCVRLRMRHGSGLIGRADRPPRRRASAYARHAEYPTAGFASPGDALELVAPRHQFRAHRALISADVRHVWRCP